MRIIGAISFYTLCWMPITAAAAAELCKAVSLSTFSTGFSKGHPLGLKFLVLVKKFQTGDLKFLIFLKKVLIFKKIFNFFKKILNQELKYICSVFQGNPCYSFPQKGVTQASKQIIKLCIFQIFDPRFVFQGKQLPRLG